MTNETLLELSEDDLDLLLELPVCGCGIPNTVYELYRAQLQATPLGAGLPGYDREADQPDYSDRLAAAEGNETLLHVVAYVLDHIEADRPTGRDLPEFP